MPRLLSLYEDCRAITRWGAACTKALEEGRPLLELYSEPYDTSPASRGQESEEPLPSLGATPANQS